MNIFKSATKLVFIAMTLATIALTFMGKLDPKDFMVLATGVFAYYFGKPRTEVEQSSELG